MKHKANSKLFTRKESKFPLDFFKWDKEFGFYYLNRRGVQYVIEQFGDGKYVASTYYQATLELKEESPNYKTIEECLAFFDGIVARKGVKYEKTLHNNDE